MGIKVKTKFFDIRYLHIVITFNPVISWNPFSAWIQRKWP